MTIALCILAALAAIALANIFGQGIERQERDLSGMSDDDLRHEVHCDMEFGDSYSPYVREYERRAKDAK